MRNLLQILSPVRYTLYKEKLAELKQAKEQNIASGKFLTGASVTDAAPELGVKEDVRAFLPRVMPSITITKVPVKEATVEAKHDVSKWQKARALLSSAFASKKDILARNQVHSTIPTGPTEGVQTLLDTEGDWVTDLRVDVPVDEHLVTNDYIQQDFDRLHARYANTLERAKERLAQEYPTSHAFLNIDSALFDGIREAAYQGRDDITARAELAFEQHYITEGQLQDQYRLADAKVRQFIYQNYPEDVKEILEEAGGLRQQLRNLYTASQTEDWVNLRAEKEKLKLRRGILDEQFSENFAKIAEFDQKIKDAKADLDRVKAELTVWVAKGAKPGSAQYTLNYRKQEKVRGVINGLVAQKAEVVDLNHRLVAYRDGKLTNRLADVNRQLNDILVTEDEYPADHIARFASEDIHGDIHRGGLLAASELFREGTLGGNLSGEMPIEVNREHSAYDPNVANGILPTTWSAVETSTRAGGEIGSEASESLSVDSLSDVPDVPSDEEVRSKPLPSLPSSSDVGATPPLTASQAIPQSVDWKQFVEGHRANLQGVASRIAESLNGTGNITNPVAVQERSLVKRGAYYAAEEIVLEDGHNWDIEIAEVQRYITDLELQLAYSTGQLKFDSKNEEAIEDYVATLTTLYFFQGVRGGLVAKADPQMTVGVAEYMDRYASFLRRKNWEGQEALVVNDRILTHLDTEVVKTVGGRVFADHVNEFRSMAIAQAQNAVRGLDEGNLDLEYGAAELDLAFARSRVDGLHGSLLALEGTPERGSDARQLKNDINTTRFDLARALIAQQGAEIRVSVLSELLSSSSS